MPEGLWINNFLNLFFPLNCNACGTALVSQENVICTSCSFKLPRTGFHTNIENPISRVFWGRVTLESASSFLFFNKGGYVQQLIHQLKYKGKKSIGLYLGKLYGNDLIETDNYKNIDIILPVPLHPKKEKERGYNQSLIIAQGLGQAMQKPVSADNLIKQLHTSSQTKKSRYSRWENVKDAFRVLSPDLLVGKHILLVDDVLTTGATIEACAAKLLEIEDVKVSVVTLANAQA